MMTFGNLLKTFPPSEFVEQVGHKTCCAIGDSFRWAILQLSEPEVQCYVK